MNSIEVKYTVAKISIHAKEPKKATIGSAVYDLFAAEENILLPWCRTHITIELKMLVVTLV